MPGAPKKIGDLMSDNEFDTIQRCPHDKENPYAMISRDLIRDKTLSPECRWLLIYLLSNDGKWIVKTSQLRSHLDGYMGRDKILAKIKEAIEAGYMKREEYKVNNLNRSRYFVSETPKFKKCFRHPEFQDPENGDPENQGPLKNKQSSYEDKNNHIQEREEASPPTPPVYKYFKKVKMKEEKYQELVQEFGEPAVQKKMERLDSYGDEKPKIFKEYGCHAAVIRRWLTEDNPKVIDNDIINYEQEHQKIAEQVVHNFPESVKKNHIQLLKTGLLFEYGRVQELIEFRDIEFRDKLTYRLTQMNLAMEKI